MTTIDISTTKGGEWIEVIKTPILPVFTAWTKRKDQASDDHQSWYRVSVDARYEDEVLWIKTSTPIALRIALA